jgi:AcrR family transcriptional regulator
VSVRSHSITAPRRVPCQERGERRVAALLNAAGSVIADVGYEAATMSEIASRAGACIGSLYQFFPNKQSLTQALRAQYGKEFQNTWESLEEHAASLTVEQLVAQLIETAIDFIGAHPAFLALLDAPSSTRNASVRNGLRQILARIFLVQKPSMSAPKAMRIATVSLQLIKGMNQLYAESDTTLRKPLVQEFKTALNCYLTFRLGAAESSPRLKKN